ncbi:MAG: EamA/RhaT family transporter [Gemmataceae bacterium]|nr:EamA/RhaT family transporter [Gemmataceae bacterium]
MVRIEILPYLWMLGGCVSFTIMGNFTFAMGESSGTGITIDWRIIALSRAGLVFFLSLFITLAAKVPLVARGSKDLWMRSIAGSISLVCTFYAMTKLQLSLVLTVTNMFPLWVALLSWPLIGKKPSRGEWAAILFGLIGVAVIQRPHWNKDLVPILAALGASLATAFAMLGLHRIKGIPARSIVVHFSGVATLFCLAVLPLSPGQWNGDGLQDWRALGFLLGVGVSATIGQIFLTLAFAKGSPTKVSIVGLSQVVFAVVGDILLWGKTLDIPTLVGMALILFPTAWAMGKGGDDYDSLERENPPVALPPE